MRGGKQDNSSEQWMRNALATGSIVAPRKTAAERGRRLSWLLGMAWLVLVALGLVALIAAAILK